MITAERQRVTTLERQVKKPRRPNEILNFEPFFAHKRSIDLQLKA
jgi:hypothetical protein